MGQYIFYTIRSTSEDGVYYLVNHWNKYNAFWKRASGMKEDMLFKHQKDARASLTKLLKIMPEYKTDSFEMFTVVKWDGSDELYPLITSMKYGSKTIFDYSDWNEERRVIYETN